MVSIPEEVEEEAGETEHQDMGSEERGEASTSMDEDRVRVETRPLEYSTRGVAKKSKMDHTIEDKPSAPKQPKRGAVQTYSTGRPRTEEEVV